MDLARLNAIDDVATLRALLVEQWGKATAYERTITEREARIGVLTADIAAVEAELEALQSPAADARGPGARGDPPRAGVVPTSRFGRDFTWPTCRSVPIRFTSRWSQIRPAA